MTPELLREVGVLLFGRSWKAVISNRFGMNRRNLRRMAAGEDRIPPGLVHDLAELCARRKSPEFDELRERLIAAVK